MGMFLLWGSQRSKSKDPNASHLFGRQKETPSSRDWEMKEGKAEELIKGMSLIPLGKWNFTPTENQCAIYANSRVRELGYSFAKWPVISWRSLLWTLMHYADDEMVSRDSGKLLAREKPMFAVGNWTSEFIKGIQERHSQCCYKAPFIPEALLVVLSLMWNTTFIMHHISIYAGILLGSLSSTAQYGNHKPHVAFEHLI